MSQLTANGYYLAWCRRPACDDFRVVPEPGEMLLDFDFHPDEDGVRVFTIPRGGVLRADPGVLVYEVRYGQVVLRHYALADQWFKLNVTTDLAGS